MNICKYRFLAGLLIAALAWPPAAWAAGGAGRDADGGPLEVQRYVIAGVRMNIPVDYLQKLEQPADRWVRRVDTVGHSISLHLLAPELAPPPHDVSRQWLGGNGYAKYLRFSIHVVLPELRETFFEDQMQGQRARGACRARAVGDACPNPYDSTVFDHIESLYTGRGHQFVVCDKAGSYDFPRCETSILLFDRVIVKTHFDRRILDFDAPIWTRVYELICSWIDWPAGRSFAIDNCRQPDAH